MFVLSKLLNMITLGIIYEMLKSHYIVVFYEFIYNI